MLWNLREPTAQRALSYANVGVWGWGEACRVAIGISNFTDEETNLER